MTVYEFYLWCVENGYENYQMYVADCDNGNYPVTEGYVLVNESREQVAIGE